MRKYFRENTKEAIMDFGTFAKLSAHTVDKASRANAVKRKKLKNA